MTGESVMEGIQSNHPIQPSQHSTLPKDTKWKTLPLNDSTSKTFTRSSIRRSFTIPRNLLPRRNDESGPVSANSSNFVRNIFLTFVRPRTKPSSKSAILEEAESTMIASPLGNLVPAAVGLKNQGNTCYMNSILQCLSHTDALAKFLVTDAYKRHLRKKLWTKQRKGEITEEFASILKNAWLRLNSSEEAAAKFKTAVDRGAPQWRGSEEHDAQEFLLWMLGRLHEDLNQTSGSYSKSKQIKKKVFGISEEEAEAIEQWAHINNSFIQEIFGAQFRSSLTCPGCGRQSSTFEPFLTISLPIPERFRDDVPVYVHVLYLSQQPRLVKLALSLSGTVDVKEVKEALSLDTGIKEMLIMEIDGEGFHRTFTDSQSISSVSKNEAIYAIETPESTSESILIVWINVLVAENTRVRFGSPYISQMCREIAYPDFQKLLLKEMAPILKAGVLVSEQEIGIFGIRIVDGSTEGTVVDSILEHPLFMEAVDDALGLCTAGTIPHLKLLLEWKPQSKEAIISDESEMVQEHMSFGETKRKFLEIEETPVQLQECFQLYTGAEELSGEDSWHCTHCNRKEEGTLKMIGLWSAPQILVLHLNRFRQGSRSRSSVSKISSLVDFPLDSFDLGPHISKRTRANTESANGGVASGFGAESTKARNHNHYFGSWKQRASFKKSQNPKRNGLSTNASHYQVNGEDEPLLYDLFAVCNHHGRDLHGGHYTAYCRNPVERNWWAFDDTRVRQLESVGEIKSASAYILFYQRRRSTDDQEGQWIRHLLRKQKRLLETERNHESQLATTATNSKSRDDLSQPMPLPIQS